MGGLARPAGGEGGGFEGDGDAGGVARCGKEGAVLRPGLVGDEGLHFLAEGAVASRVPLLCVPAFGTVLNLRTTT